MIRRLSSLKRARSLVLAAAMSASMSACASYQDVGYTSDQISRQITENGEQLIGEKVEVKTVDGRRESFTVTSISEDEISGSTIAVPLDDIESIKTKELSLVRTGALVGGGAVLAYAALSVSAIFAVIAAL